MDELKLYIRGALVEATSKEAAIEHYMQLKSVYVEGGNAAAPY
jgi:hypothetical protein